MVQILLTFVIGELQIVVHGGHKLLNDETSYDGRQVTFTPHLPVKHLYVVICRGTERKLSARMLEVCSEGVKVRREKAESDLPGVN